MFEKSLISIEVASSVGRFMCMNIHSLILGATWKTKKTKQQKQKRKIIFLILLLLSLFATVNTSFAVRIFPY